MVKKAINHNDKPINPKPRRYVISDNTNGQLEPTIPDRWLILDTIDNKYVLRTDVFKNAISYLARMNKDFVTLTSPQSARRLRLAKFKRRADQLYTE